VGWLVVGLVALSGLLAGALAWAVRERRLRGAAEVERDLLQQHLGVATRSLEQRDAELSSARLALILAQQEAREAGERERIARLSDQAVAEGLAAALAARRAAPRGGAGADPAADSLAGILALASADTAPDIHGLAARTSALPAGPSLPAGSGGPGGARGLGPR